MNNSGVCIKELIEYFKIEVKNVFVFHDDMDIDIGKVKVIDAYILYYGITHLNTGSEFFKTIFNLRWPEAAKYNQSII